jgi:hypothetical protein
MTIQILTPQRSLLEFVVEDSDALRDQLGGDSFDVGAIFSRKRKGDVVLLRIQSHSYLVYQFAVLDP